MKLNHASSCATRWPAARWVVVTSLLIGCQTARPIGPPPDIAPDRDEQLELARTIAAAGVPSPTPQLDRLAALSARTSPELGLRDVLGPAEAPEMPLRAGDAFEMAVITHPELSGTFVVRSDGSAELGPLGPRRVADLSPGELRDRLRAELKANYLQHDPSVAVRVTTRAPRSVRVVGRVGAHSIGADGGQPLTTTLVPLPPERGLGVYELLAMVQGLAPDADPDHLTLLRVGEPERGAAAKDGARAAAGSRAFHFSYDELVQAHLRGQEVWLQPDDQLVVPRLPDVFIQGAVLAPGRYPLRAGTTVASLLLQSGGGQPTADLARVLVLQGEEAREATPSDALAPGDVVFVPETPRVYVVGRGVARNGPLFLPGTGLTAVQAIAEAGWFTEFADLDEVAILRDVRGRRTRIVVPVEEILAGEREERDYLLRPGDTVEVPEGLW